MACTCVVGLQWGDEAKGKIVDLLTDQHDLVVRYNGGANAGHTVVCGGQTYKFSLLPTGVLRPVSCPNRRTAGVSRLVRCTSRLTPAVRLVLRRGSLPAARGERRRGDAG